MLIVVVDYLLFSYFLFWHKEYVYASTSKEYLVKGFWLCLYVCGSCGTSLSTYVLFIAECHNSHKIPLTKQGIINMNRNGNFCKGTWVSEVIAETKVRRPCWTMKKVHWFFSHVCNGKFSVFWVLCCGITCK